MKIIKKGQTNPVYSAYTNRVFEHIQLLVQSRESKSHSMCHFLIILLNLKYSCYYKIKCMKSQKGLYKQGARHIPCCILVYKWKCCIIIVLIVIHLVKVLQEEIK